MRRVVIADKEEEKKAVDTKQAEQADVLKRAISFRNRDIPDKLLFNVELNGLADKIKNIKIENKQYELVTKIQSVLDLFDKEDNKYNEQLLLFAMQAVENYITKPHSGDFKLAVVIECVKDYFKGDADLIVKMVEILMPRIKKMNIVRRNWKRVSRFFCATRSNDV